jgi:tetratricopeptide (TPR) repeat protein
MNINKKFGFLVVPFVIGIALTSLPAAARLEGGIFQGHFYDTQSTIMSDIIPETTIKTGKYWDNNPLYFNRYRPLFMLSNKELYSVAPEKKESIFERILAPSVYNISLKNSSVTRISLSAQPPLPKAVAKKYPPVITRAVSELPSNPVAEEKPQSSLLAENPTVPIEKRNEEALNSTENLKDTNKTSNYNMPIDMLDEVTQKEPYNAEAFSAKGDIYYMQGDMEKAMQNYAQALKINPYCKQSCLGIAKILEQSDKPLAQKYFARANAL